MENLDNMNRKDDEIRRILQGPLGEGDHSWAEPGEQVWTNIEANLSEKKNRGGFWWWFGGLLSVLLIALFLIPKLSGSSSEEDNSTRTPTVELQPQQMPANSSSSSIQSDSENDLIRHQQADDQKGLSPTSSTSTGSGKTQQKSEKSEWKGIEHNQMNASSQPQPKIQLPASEQEAPAQQSRDSETGSEDRADQVTPEHGTPVRITDQLPSDIQMISQPSPPELTSFTLLNPVPAINNKLSDGVKKSTHRLLIYGHGISGDRRIERKSNNIFDPEFGHENSQFRFGAGYEWQHQSGLFAGTGVAYQEFQERVEKEKKWVYTIKNATQVGSDLYQQNIPVVINSGFGTASTTLRVDMEGSSLPTDYQEGDPVIFKMTVDHSLKYIRVPLYLGYQYEWRRWFGEVRAGSGLQIYMGSKAQVTQVAESKGKIRIRETETINQLKYVRPAIWDLQGGLYAGYRWSDAWSVSCGYEYWQSLQSVVDRPNVKTFTSGSGVQLALRRSF